MINVLFVAHENDMGGATKSLLSLVKEMKLKKTCNPIVLVRRNKSNLTLELEANGIEYIKCYYPWIRSDKARSFLVIALVISFFMAIYLSLFKGVNKRKFDVIHTNSSVVGVGFILSIITKIKHVWHFREFGDRDFNLKYPLKNKFMFYLFNKGTMQYIFISKVLSEHYREIPSKKKNIVYNGFDTKMYQELFKDHIFPPITDDKIYLLTSGSFSRGKKQDTAIKAVHHLRENGIECKLFIAGKGNEDYLSELKIMVNELNVCNEVEFIGYQDDLTSFRKNSNFELVCSKSEAFGRVSVEAMLSNLFVIASNVGANIEIIDEGKTGGLYIYDNHVSLANKILEYSKNKDRYNKIVRSANNQATDNYNIERVVAEIMNVYKICK